MKVAIIADDITGANDSGVQLAKSGLKTAVWLNNEQETNEPLEAVVIDTDSRAMSQDDAKEAIKSSMDVLATYQPEILFKKVDSTLRGNVGAELYAMIQADKPDYVLLTPSFPESKRTVDKGILYVDGTAIGETEFALNEADPVKDSRIADHVGRQFKGQLLEVPEELWTKAHEKITTWLRQQQTEKGCVFICDATSSHTLKAIAEFAQTSQDHILLAGSAGLSSALEIKSSGVKRQVERKDPTLPILYLVGSMSDISRKQVQQLLKQESAVGIKIDALKAVNEDEFVRASEFERVSKEAHSILEEQKIPVIFSGTERHEIDAVYAYAEEQKIALSIISQRIVSLLAAVGENLTLSHSFQAIVMTGGDTAKALCKRVSVSQLDLIDEFETGIPISIFTGSLAGTYAITKAGAFGTEFTFSNIYQFFMEGTTK
ncbi:four-carbon acid sugar kinase family protein [Alkalicoccobacillus plakortidis]|uniref:Four-carbon acid sugar kinase family protein n=1 Tax=Alkalicoccobacillus plakortidis TaxID=444060 RepID=A0ABT0XJC2_9BACI|nr:four-carbon acid sugar kinase family protein [Alkalicoccobacillus plakortidis]MCM2675820.1 four-carbon acid sugar kinase family protein [Alkalicoccobacillus plakortidis]